MGKIGLNLWTSRHEERSFAFKSINHEDEEKSVDQHESKLRKFLQLNVQLRLVNDRHLFDFLPLLSISFRATTMKSFVDTEIR